MARRKSRDNEAQLDELGSDPGQVGPDSAGQSGDTRGLSQIADAMDTHEDKHLRDPEDRMIEEYSEEQKKDKAMDKTLADSFPASDPPAWQS